MMLAMLGALLAVLLGFAGLAVDAANGYTARQILQHAVDDAGRTAQRWSAQVNDPGVDAAAVQTQAVAAGVATARRDLQAAGLAAVTVIDTSLVGTHLRIAAQASVPTWFLRALGILLWRPAAASDVVLWAAAMPAPGPGEGPAGTEAQGPQPGDTVSGPGPADAAGPGPDAPGPTGGDIVEGP
jgi:hypothetical protein